MSSQQSRVAADILLAVVALLFVTSGCQSRPFYDSGSYQSNGYVPPNNYANLQRGYDDVPCSSLHCYRLDFSGALKDLSLATGFPPFPNPASACLLNYYLVCSAKPARHSSYASYPDGQGGSPYKGLDYDGSYSSYPKCPAYICVVDATRVNNEVKANTGCDAMTCTIIEG